MNEIAGFSLLDAEQKSLQYLRRGLGLDKNALRVVDYPAFQVHFLCQAVDERAEADALDGAANYDPNALESAGSHNTQATRPYHRCL